MVFLKQKNSIYDFQTYIRALDNILTNPSSEHKDFFNKVIRETRDLRNKKIKSYDISINTFELVFFLDRKYKEKDFDLEEDNQESFSKLRKILNTYDDAPKESY